MNNIRRIDLDEEWAHSGIVIAGEFAFISYCMANEGQSIINQINGAFDVLEHRLMKIDLDLSRVVKIDCLFKNIMDLQYLGDIIKKKFKGQYPSRKAFETNFIRYGIHFQMDAIAYTKK
jgi:2-iminobutanoate/2-iminopropanoate deaminase